ncbi:MAG: ATP-binding protein [Acidobacteriota bacterium]|nr:ATP-binding protein [Acidobacteriota bacterium]
MNSIKKSKPHVSGFDRRTLAKFVTVEKKEIVIPSKIDSVDKAVVEATDFASAAGFGDEAVFAIDMAVREAVINAVKHGNRLDETKRVEISFSNLDKGFEVTIRDYGAGFDVSEIPDPTDPENLLKANGRGILFMRNFMEEVEWFQHPHGGTVVKMCKLREK